MTTDAYTHALHVAARIFAIALDREYRGTRNRAEYEAAASRAASWPSVLAADKNVAALLAASVIIARP